MKSSFPRQRRQASKRGVSGGDVGQPNHLRADPFAVHEAKLPQAVETPEGHTEDT